MQWSINIDGHDSYPVPVADLGQIRFPGPELADIFVGVGLKIKPDWEPNEIQKRSTGSNQNN